MRKANAILEYGVLLVIVVGAMAGINFYLERHIQARIKHESDTHLGRGQGLEWDASIGITKSSSDVHRVEAKGADFNIHAESESRSITYTPATPPHIMEHKGSALHVQDAATSPPRLDYPDLEYKDWEDKRGEWHVKY